jgi:hypothetical protein
VVICAVCVCCLGYEQIGSDDAEKERDAVGDAVEDLLKDVVAAYSGFYRYFSGFYRYFSI